MAKSFFRNMLITTTVLLSIISCTSNEIGESKDVNPDTIWFDYRIWGQEGTDEVTVKLQYRFAGETGTTLVLTEPGKVELDGLIVPVDSSKYAGAYYEVQEPVDSFKGKHTIVFTDINKKQYKEEFHFHPIALRTNIPASVTRADLVFELDGLEPVDYVRVLMSDTSSKSDGINRVDTVKNGRLFISKSQLESLANGPITLELIKEDEKAVKNGTAEGGKISVSYGLQREFSLKD